MLESLVATDHRVASWFHAHSDPGITALMHLVSDLHSQLLLCVYAAIFALYLARRHEWRWVRTVILVVPVGLLVNVGLKDLFARARPHFEPALVSLDTYSFPSGHTAGATLLYGVLAAYIGARARTPRSRLAAVAGAVLMVALVALSRIYLEAHYLTDVLGAFLWASAWTALWVFLLSPWQGERRAIFR